jgi:predicted dehydrogenase
MGNEIKLGIVGACHRGGSFKAATETVEGLRVQAVCDLNAERLPEAAAIFEASLSFTDYERMLDEADLDAVIIGTPMHVHAEQSIAALERGIHVLCEVTAAVDLDQCRRLVAACSQSDSLYMMGENYRYHREVQIVDQLVKAGLFGKLYYAEGEYLHEIRWEQLNTPWRRRWLTGTDGVTYGTHSLGPILKWMNDDRVERICCAGSGNHYDDDDGRAFEAQDTSVMLCQMRSGGLAKIRVDMISDRPYSMRNFQLQGTDGCYESSRAPDEPHRIWLRSHCERDQWVNLHDLAGEFESPLWRQHGEQALATGHSGADAIELIDFVNAIRSRGPSPIDIHETMDMTLPGLISQQSIAQAGQWLDVPDSRQW